MGFVTLILGFIILLFGRTLFWLGIAIAGFLVGTEYAHVMFAAHPQWVVLAVAIGAGVVGAVLAVLVKRVAFALVGFYAGIYLGLIVV